MFKPSSSTLRPLAASLAFLTFMSAADAQQVDRTPRVAHIDAHISVEQTIFHAGDPVEVAVTFTNTTPGRVAFLPWNTPLEGFFYDNFEVSKDQQPMTYEGRAVFRFAPTQADHLVLEPYESVSTVVDVAGAYEMRTEGQYSICLNAFIPPLEEDLVGIRSAGWGQLNSNRIAVDIIGNVDERPTGQNEAVNSTTVDVLGDLLKETKKARDKAKEAKDCVKDNADFKKWFGAATPECLAQVKKNWCAIVDGFNKPITYCYDPGCPPNVAAYVYPCQTNKIYLCPAFFNLPPGYTQWGIIIHEMSHFKAGAGTDDHAYGCKASCKLAMTDPKKAKQNADSYRLFIEKKGTVVAVE